MQIRLYSLSSQPYKRCFGCNKLKPAHVFRKFRNVPTSVCVSCSAETERVWKERESRRHQEAELKRQSARAKALKAARSRGAHRRRALLAQVEYDPSVNVVDLFVRDGGVCGICGEDCQIEQMSVDHVVPISKGGSHTWDNVQLAHLICNLRKGAR